MSGGEKRRYEMEFQQHLQSLLAAHLRAYDSLPDDAIGNGLRVWLLASAADKLTKLILVAIYLTDTDDSLHLRNWFAASKDRKELENTTVAFKEALLSDKDISSLHRRLSEFYRRASKYPIGCLVCPITFRSRLKTLTEIQSISIAERDALLKLWDVRNEGVHGTGLWCEYTITTDESVPYAIPPSHFTINSSLVETSAMQPTAQYPSMLESMTLKSCAWLSAHSLGSRLLELVENLNRLPLLDYAQARKIADDRFGRMPSDLTLHLVGWQLSELVSW